MQESTTLLNTSTAWSCNTVNLNNYDPWNPITYIPLIQTHYFPYLQTWETDKTGRAMRLIQVLIEKKLMKEPKTVGEFIEVVNKVAELI